jgi:L-asparagine transporter-like permease
LNSKEKGLSSWQLTMMALGTVIGGSFFLGSSVAIAVAGPSILISYILGGALVYLILFALSEMTVASPKVGSFCAFATREFGQGAGFVVGWVYWTGMILAMSSEATAISILVRAWVPDLSISLLSSIIIAVVTLLNLFGADRLSKIESVLAAIKIFTIIFFIILALLLIFGFLHGEPVGLGELKREAFMASGIKGIAGSMLIVMFSYAGFEIIGLAASEAHDPVRTIPKAILATVIMLVGLYIVYIAVLLPLIPTSELNENISPIVAALKRWGMNWAGTVINIVLISAIFSTMLASVFGLGRMVRSLSYQKCTPKILYDKTDVPYRGILFSGFGMLAGLGLGLLFPRVYLFLISSGGFALLFTYVVIIATHMHFRKKNGCPPEGKCQMPGYPYTSVIALLSLIAVIGSMPFISGQAAGLLSGISIILIYSTIYLIRKKMNIKNNDKI